MIRELIVVILVLGSGFFFMVGTIGLIRLPDVFSRMHATAKSDTLGAGLALLALIVYQGFNPISLKLFFILVFISITNPVSAHIMAKSAYYHDQKRNKEADNANS